jgi:type II secretory pathway pseudopilin PulG
LHTFIKNRRKSGARAGAYTLVELLISVSIFAMLAVICVSVLVNSLASARRLYAQVFLYSEAQNLMDHLAREVERSALDYEAYYLRYGNRSPESDWNATGYGLYGQSFYHPGTGNTTVGGPYSTITGYGILCSDGLSTYPDGCPTETPIDEYKDTNTGTHPFTGIEDFLGFSTEPSSMNAFCEPGGAIADCSSLKTAVVEELLLINRAGTERMAFIQELSDSGDEEYQISRLEFTGIDDDSDGIVESWTPDPSGFMPLTPPSLTIERFHVFVSPVEDPYRAFAEVDMQVQPQVTVVFNATLGNSFFTRLLGQTPRITLQRTFSTGVYGEVKSYE